MCTLLVEKGTFTKTTNATAGINQIVTLANATLTPKVLWLWSCATTTANAYAENFVQSYGFSDGTTDYCTMIQSQDNQGTMIVQTGCYATGVIAFATIGTTTTRALADVFSFSAGRFELNWATSDTTPDIIHYMVMGGTDITNVKVVSKNMGTAAGNVSYTGVGFQGDFVNLITYGNTIAGTIANSSSTVSTWIMGAATSATAEWMFGGSSEHNAGSADTYNYKEITACLGNYESGTGSVTGLADFVSFGADGFTLNWSDAPANDLAFGALVIKGGLWNVGNGTAPASTGDQTITTTSGRDAQGVMFFTWGATGTTSGAAGEAENRISIGGGDNNLVMGCMSAHDDDGAATSVNTSISLNNKLIHAHTANATAASSTVVAEATLTDMSSNGSFDVNWSTTLSGMGYVWFTVSQAFAGGNNVQRALPAETITSSDSRIVSRNKIRARTETVTASG